jgi:hypothetical protein
MTLREVFDELAGGGDADPAGALADRGYGELPEPLLSEAIVSYADTAPVEVAEHLSPFVMVHSAVPVDRDGDVAAGDGLELLATAPEPIVADDDGVEEPAAAEPANGELSFEEFEFGHGAEAVDAWDAAAFDVPGPEFEPEQAADLGAEAPEEPEQTDIPAGSWLDRTETAAADEEPTDGGDDAGA